MTLSIELEDKIIADIDALVGVEGRDEFVAQAADFEVRRLRMLSFIRSNEVVMKDEDHPEFVDGTAAYVRRMRAGKL